MTKMKTQNNGGDDKRIIDRFRWAAVALLETTRLVRQSVIAVVIGSMLTLLPAAQTAAQDARSWTGEWQTYWRSSQALMTLQQEGEVVTGTYEPGGGQIEARVDKGVLTGTWRQGDARGGIIFAMSAEGDTFTGRYDSGEYWNGQRVTEAESELVPFTASNNPRETLRTVVTAANEAVYGGNAAAMRIYDPLLIYEGKSTGSHERTRRRNALWRILNMSTFRIYDVPKMTESSEARFSISPAGTDEGYDLRFRLDSDGRWKIVVEAEENLEAAIDRMLADLGYETVGELTAARARSPRATMYEFITGVHEWEQGGAERALATLDLSFLPAQLRSIEGLILADYLKQIIDRAGFVIWQEIPDDPDMPPPLVHYQHPAGSVVIERKSGGEGEPDQWLFSAETLKSAPQLFGAIQELPIAEGIDLPRPLSEFFILREWIRSLSPHLLHRGIMLENWQWLALGLAFLFALALARFAGWIATKAIALLSRSAGTEIATNVALNFDWPVRVAVAGLFSLYAFAQLGVAHSGLNFVGRTIALIVAIASGFLVYRLVGVIGADHIRRAEKTPSYVDVIVASIATGFLKLTVIVLTAIACADVVGLPYEGVITGLGIGGVALAFAARDSVANMLGGAMILADRPFKRGDLIETEGQRATVEAVGLRSTRLRTFDDSVLIIPNSQLADKAVVNWGRRRRRKVILEIGLTYETPREKLDTFVERLRSVYEAQPSADKTECYIGLKSFGASSFDIELWGYFNVLAYDAQVRAQHALIGDIVDLAKEVGVSFAFPTRTIHVARKDDLQRLEQAAE